MRMICAVLEATPSHEVNLYHLCILYRKLDYFKGRQMTFTYVLIHRHVCGFYSQGAS